jgi:thiol-disulfide isomerase/thioredoxin
VNVVNQCKIDIYEDYGLEVNRNMKNPMAIVAVIAVIAVLGIGVYTLMKKDVVTMPKEGISLEPTNAMVKKSDNSVNGKKKMDDTVAGSRYVQYSREEAETAAGVRRVLYFYASWCPTCKYADISFTQNVSKVPGDVILIRINYNDPETDQEEKDLAKKYGITYQHTFVQIDDTGKEVTRWNGGQIDELLSNIK